MTSDERLERLAYEYANEGWPKDRNEEIRSSLCELLQWRELGRDLTSLATEPQIDAEGLGTILEKARRLLVSQ